MTIYRSRILPLLLSLVISLLSPAALCCSGAEARAALVTFDDGASAEAVLQAVSALPDTRILYRYDTIFSGAAVETSEASLSLMRKIPGVSGVDFAARHSRSQAIADPLIPSNSLDAMGWADPDYTGDGMVIAVIDSGLRYTHRAFAENDLTQSPAISREDVEAFIEEGGTKGRYLSQRIPFAFDYCGGDQDVTTADSHGTHVSALAVGYALDESGDVAFRGAAPAAQLLSMKVFPDNANAGASDADILKALEDAYLLGADVICLSLGVDGGFTSGTAIHALYAGTFAKLRQAGVIVCCAAGNSGTTVTNKPEGTTLPTTAYTDYGTIASPASYEGTTAIAAANARVIQSAGYIQAGGRQLGYTAASSETGQDLPTLEKLSGKTLSAAMVGGAGRAEDFAAVDVRGKVAIVCRGEITFTEKAHNAAKAGAVACLFINNTAEDITPITDDVSIPCALLSQADGAYLLERMAKGEHHITISTGTYLQELSAQPNMMPLSAWGTTAALHIAPALTAPGGGILSASAQGDDLYEQFSGTSMAAPNAAGAYALVLQKLYRDGLTKGEKAADTAEDLLTSTARLLRTDSGIPLSPRQQGAGLIDLDAALNAEILVTDPLLELGENPSGQFTLSFRVQNLTDEAVELALTPTVLTDDWTEHNGISYSLLSPRDLTGQAAVSGPDALTLPAGGEQAVTLQVTIPPALRQQLLQVYSNGFFVEGYISLAARTGQQAHATFLGYCGDWEQGSIVEQTDFRDVLNAEADGNTLPETDLGLSMVYLSGDSSLLLGQNPCLSAASNDDHFAISTFESDALCSDGALFAARLCTLRNAQRLIMVISDRSSGRIYYVDDLEQVPHSALSPLTGEMEHFAQFQWAGTTMDGAALADGTRVTVEFYGWTESDTAMTDAYTRSGSSPLRPNSYRWLTSGSYDRCLEWSFPLTIDRSAPAVSAAMAGETLTLTVTDTQFLAYAAVADGDGAVLAEAAYSGGRAAQPHVLMVDLSGYETLPDSLYVTAADYAANTSGYAVDLSTTQSAPCAMCLLTDVDMDAWYHEAVDLVWQAGLMKDDEALSFQPNRGATRADVISALHKAAGSPKADVSLSFTDANSGAWYYEALQWASGEGLVTGYGENTFGAFAFVSRQQLAAILYRYAACLGEAAPADAAALSAFPDAEDVDGWAADAMAWAVSEGLISGRADGTLAPGASATRAELAQILVRFLKL